MTISSLACVAGEATRVDPFAILFKRQCTRKHHEDAPLSIERQAYLRHLIEKGMKSKGLRDTAALLIHVIHALDLTESRYVTRNEIKEAGSYWASQDIAHRRSSRGKSALRFNTAANGWLRFQELLINTPSPASRFDQEIGEFCDHLDRGNGYLPTTIRGIKGPVKRFLRWAAERTDRVGFISFKDIDNYLDEGRAIGWRPSTLASHCQGLRIFFRYADRRGWCKPGMWRTITSPTVRKKDSAISGPSWSEVRRMIKMTGCSTASDTRTKVVLLFCAVYGFRNAEIVRLTLDNIDWRNGTISVKRAKRGPWQSFPICHELGEAVIHYLKNVRPRCTCRNLFVTLVPPYRPLQSITPMVRRQMIRAGVKLQTYGAHSLRHACATELLRQGSTLQDIATFLGHRDIRSVSIYAKFDERSLNKVAEFSLAALL